MKSSSTDIAYNPHSPEVAFANSALGKTLKRCLSESGASSRAVAEYLLRNPVRVAAFGINELAEQCAVSTATVSRFAREVGFTNYAAMRSEVAATMQGLLQPVEKLRTSFERRDGKTKPLAQSLEYSMANIAATVAGLSESDGEAVLKKIKQARCVYVMGFGLSAHLAGFLALHLQPFCEQIIEVAGSGGTEVAAGHLATITQRDLLVVISFPRYSLDVLRLTAFAKSRNASIVALTDSPASPLAELSDIALYAQGTHAVLPSSSSAALALIEALAASLMVSNKDNVEKAARLTEAISAYLYGEENIRSKNPKNR